MGEKGWVPENLFDVFGDELARQILILAGEKPLSAEEIAEYCSASLPTVYRRTSTLVQYDLLKEQPQVDADGNHYNTYETTLKRITFEIEGNGFNVDVQLRRSLTDQFEAFWDDLEESSRDLDRELTSHSDNQRRGTEHHE